MWLRIFGFDLKRFCTAITSIQWYLRERRAFKSTNAATFAWGRSFPILDERNEASGDLGAYFYQDSTVARWIYERSPARHVDVGSRLDGFIGHLSIFRQVDVLDIRPQPLTVENVQFFQVDLMQILPDEWIECTDSLSCLHTIEHFGLGRYGDTIDTDGYLKGLEQLKQLVKSGGRLYLSTPIGPQRVEFNAHRIFSARTVVDWFHEGWEIEEFACIKDNGMLYTHVDWRGIGSENHFDCQTGVGIVMARKL